MFLLSVVMGYKVQTSGGTSASINWIESWNQGFTIQGVSGTYQRVGGYSQISIQGTSSVIMCINEQYPEYRSSTDYLNVDILILRSFRSSFPRSWSSVGFICDGKRTSTDSLELFHVQCRVI